VVSGQIAKTFKCQLNRSILEVCQWGHSSSGLRDTIGQKCQPKDVLWSWSRQGADTRPLLGLKREHYLRYTLVVPVTEPAQVELRSEQERIRVHT